MPSPIRFPRIAGSLYLGLSLALAGCGGGGSSSTDVDKVAAAQDVPTATAASADSVGPPAAFIAPETKQITQVNGIIGADMPLAVPVVPADLTTQVSTAALVADQGLTTSSAVTSTRPSMLYVSTDGNDQWTGLLASPNATRTDGPKLTISAAQVAVRAQILAMSTANARRPITVQIAAGTYRLAAPLAFGPGDSGGPGAPVLYTAAQPGAVKISGAVAVGTATPTSAGALVALPAPVVDAGAVRGGTQLLVNGRRATLARTPNADNFWFVQKSLPLIGEPVGQTGKEAFVPPVEAMSLVNNLNSTDRERAIVTVMQAWSAGHHRLSSLAAPAGGMRLTPRTAWPFLYFGFDQRFYIENLPSALDAPGEWIWNGNTISYLATAADVGQTVKLEIPMIEKLVVILGNEAAGTWVQDLQFNGLTFSDTRYLTPDAGFIDRQAANDIGAAVEVDAARRIVFENCNFTRTGGYAVWLRNSVRESRIGTSQMSDLGAGGIKVGLAAQSPTYLNGTGANTLFGNRITETGKLVPGAVGIWIGQSFDNVVSNNLIANTTYTAISVGWSWQYGTPTSGRNAITKNLLFNIGQGALSDLGAIYTLGESPGTVISGNVIQEVRSYPGYGAGSWGLYNDESSTDILVERNIVVGTSTGGYLLHRGRNNTLRSNILASGDRSEVQVALSDPLNTKLTVSNNLLIPKVTAPLQWFAAAPDVLYSNNQVSTALLKSVAPDLVKCNGGCVTTATTLAVNTDPRVITLTGADSATFAWVAQVTAQVGPPGYSVATAPPVATTPPPTVVAPPIGYELDIAGTAIGAKPALLSYRTGTNSNAIAVVTSAGSPIGKCLNFVDSPSNPNRWDPHAWATLNHTVGTSTVEFSMLIDANTNFLHEWRDDATTFKIGPSLRVTANGISVRGKIIAPATVGKWMTFKVTATLGSTASTWRLDVTPAQGVTTSFQGLAFGNTDWNRLNWLGFVSDSNLTSNTCIGGIKALNPGV